MRCDPSERLSCGLTWPVILVTLAIIAGLAWVWWTLQVPAYVARVNGQNITRNELAAAMRSDLWRRGLAWEALSPQDQAALREKSLTASIDSRLIALLPVSTSAIRGNEAFQQFIKQFEVEETWQARMAAQGLTEAHLQERLTAEADQMAAFEALVKESVPPVTEAEAAAWFREHQAGMKVPERMRASHFFLSGHDVEKPDRTLEMQEFHRQLTAGETTLPELAGNFSEDGRSKKKGGSLGWFSRERMPEDFTSKVFALPIGTLSAPFQTRLGWHIVIVHERLPERQATLKETLPEITAMLETERRTQAVQKILTDLRSKAVIERQEAALAVAVPAK